MPDAYFQIPLSVIPKGGGEAELEPPKVLKSLNICFLIVREDGEEGIIKVQEPESVLKEIETDKNCRALTEQQVAEETKKYQKPKLKSRYRMRAPVLKQDETGASNEPYELDEKGNKIIDTFQTVRSGFYLIDVPVIGVQDKT